jgi:hypothetical protein
MNIFIRKFSISPNIRQVLSRGHARVQRGCGGIPAENYPTRDAFGHGCGHRSVRKNEHVKKVFWTVFVAMAGLVLARVVDPATAQQVVGIITGTG